MSQGCLGEGLLLSLGHVPHTVLDTSCDVICSLLPQHEGGRAPHVRFTVD